MQSERLTSVFGQEVENKLYNKVKLTIDFVDKILAGIPQSGNMLDYFISTKHMSDAEKEDFIARIRAGDLTDEEKAEIKETNWTTFERDREGYLTIWANNAKAMIRECISTLGMYMERKAVMKKGEEKASAKQTFQHGISVESTNPGDLVRLRLLTDGKYQRKDLGNTRSETFWMPFEDGKFVSVKEPHGYVDRVKHISDASGKRSAIGRHDFMDRPRIELIIKWIANEVYSLDDMKNIWFVAQDDGLGASRSQGFGKFKVTGWEVLNEVPRKVRKKDAETESAEVLKKDKL
jgi:hypothetical protein